MSVPLWHGQIRGKCGLTESLYLSNKIRRLSDSLEVRMWGWRQIRGNETEQSWTNSSWSRNFFCRISLFQDRRKRTRDLNCYAQLRADFLLPPPPSSFSSSATSSPSPSSKQHFLYCLVSGIKDWNQFSLQGRESIGPVYPLDSNQWERNKWRKKIV